MTNIALIVADEDDKASNVSAVLKFLEYDVLISNDLASAQEALDKASDKEGNFLIAIVSMSDEKHRAQIISLINKEIASLPIYLLQGNEASPSQDAKPRGVSGNLGYPVVYKDLLSRIRHAELERKSSRGSTALLSTLTGNSPQIKGVEALIRHVSMTDANVLLLGESGTGKEVVARGIHHLSLRTDQPFVAVNCGAIPPELLESELFGHEKGAFTGAINTRRGRFELAEGGTLFLDEIGDMPMPMQVKLLRVLQERTFERVGGTKTITSNVRLIAATHQDLEKRIGEGKFRMDLFYRLNVFPIELPPIRERPDDIPLLIEQFSSRMELDHRSPIEFDASAIKSLSSHPLLGNVRELENLVERLAILFPGETITNDKLPKRYQQQVEPSNNSQACNCHNSAHAFDLSDSHTVAENIDLKQHLTSLEKSIIIQALERNDWVVSQAAKSLSVQRTTLIQKIRKLDIQFAKRNELDEVALPL